MESGAYTDFPHISSLHVKPIQSDEHLDEGDISEPEIIRIGTIKPNAVWDRLEDAVREAKQKPHWRSMDHYSVFIDFGSLSIRETPAPWDGEGGISKVKEKADQGGLLLDGGDSHLWSKFCCNLQSIGLLIIFVFSGSSFSNILRYSVIWLFCGFSPIRLLLE